MRNSLRKRHRALRRRRYHMFYCVFPKDAKSLPMPSTRISFIARCSATTSKPIGVLCHGELARNPHVLWNEEQGLTRCPIAARWNDYNRDAVLAYVYQTMIKTWQPGRL